MLFIADPVPDYLTIPDPGVKKAPDPGSGSATLVGVGVVYLRLRNSTAAAPPGVQHNSVLLALLKQIKTLRPCSSVTRL